MERSFVALLIVAAVAVFALSFVARADAPPWTLAALERFAPVAKRTTFEGYEETEAEARARYASIAADIDATTTSRNERALLVALAVGESGLALDTDRGPCFRGKPGGPWWKRCDSGTSGSIWQLKTPLAWEGETLRYEDTFADRPRAARIALSRAKGSLHACRKLPAVDRLSALGGACREGLESARARYRLWQRVAAFNP